MLRRAALSQKNEWRNTNASSDQQQVPCFWFHAKSIAQGSENIYFVTSLAL
jgi:hypothetical protein